MIELNSERWLNVTDLEEEIWKDIVGYENYYQISNWGRVKSLKYNHSNFQKILRTQLTKKGYVRVTFQIKKKRKSFSVHRLVAEAFIPNPENKPQVNHKDTNKQNNKLENLEWNTNGENQRHSVTNGLKFMKKTLQYDLKGNFIKEWNSTKEIERELGIYNARISRCCLGEYTHTHGYIFVYEEDLKVNPLLVKEKINKMKKIV